MAKKTSKGSNSNSRKSSRSFFALMILFAIIVGLWWVVDGRSPDQTPQVGSHKYRLIKTGAGTVVDFGEASRTLDMVVTKAVGKSKFKSSIGDRTVREVPRTQIEGSIKWETRQISLAVPPGGRTAQLEEELARVVTKSGGKVFDTVADTLEGRSALRMRIGLEDRLDGEAVTVITHTIWFVTAADASVSPPPENQAAEKEPIKPTVPSPTVPSPASPKATGAVKERGRLALVIDDFGLTMNGVQALIDMEQPLTFAIIPYHPYSASIAQQAAAQGKQVILHLPMESIGGEKAEPSTILTTMSDQQIKTRTREALATVPQAIGINNHQGSKATADSRVMKAVLSIVRERNLFFVDSRTNAASVAAATARNMSIQTAENDHFIDNSSDIAMIKQELRVAGRLAIQQGEAIAIGHIRPNTVIALREMLPELEAMGVRIVFVSQLVR